MILNYLIAFLKWLLPIVRQATIQVAADTLTEAAYPKRRGTRYGFNQYNRKVSRSGYNRYGVSAADEEADRLQGERERREIEALRKYAEKDVELTKTLWQQNVKHGYHDVLLVAFDISAPNPVIAQEFLKTHMPAATDYAPSGVSIDSWWIADDNADGDCDSAIFVAKGRQGEAREFMGRNFPTDPEAD